MNINKKTIARSYGKIYSLGYNGALKMTYELAQDAGFCDDCLNILNSVLTRLETDTQYTAAIVTEHIKEQMK